MELFEIHITGSLNILNELDRLGFKRIVIHNLDRKGNKVSEHFMSSIKQKFQNIDDCIKWTNGLCDMLEVYGVEIYRKKIETPFYHHYLGRCLYVETHWEDDTFEYPTSLNAESKKIMATVREYCPSNFEVFRFDHLHKETEMCLYDTYTSEDSEWFRLYE